jgi:hypothetical protein
MLTAVDNKGAKQMLPQHLHHQQLALQFMQV